MVKRNMPAPLPFWEQVIYWITECMTMCCMFYSLHHASEDVRGKNKPVQIEDGWAVIGRPMDTADYEWIFWTNLFWNLLPWVCGHVLLSLMITIYVNSFKIKAVLFTVYGFLATGYLLGFWTVVVFCAQSVVLYLVSKLGSAKVVWFTSLLFLTFMNLWENVIVQWLYDHTDDYADIGVDAWFNMCVFMWGGLFQRSTAFALECVWAQQSHPVPICDPLAQEGPHSTSDLNSATVLDLNKAKHKPVPDPLPQVPSWLDMFVYIFYFPLFFVGPLMVYNNFHRQLREPQPWSKERLQDIILRLLRILFWAVMNFVILHFIYPHAIKNSVTILKKQSHMTIAAIGYSLGQFFMMKYLVLFGLPAQLARLDGFEPPAVPACISYIYCYSDMWRSFDKGLYDFMKRYIFIPFGGSHAGLGYQIMGSVLCFAFVYYWHGADYYLFLWCVLNFVETALEQVGAWLENTNIISRHIYGRLSPAAIRRVRAVMSVPMFLMSVFAIFYFFAGIESGAVFLHKLLIDIPWDSFAVFLILVYCAIQNAMEVERLGLTKVKLKVSAHRD